MPSQNVPTRHRGWHIKQAEVRSQSPCGCPALPERADNGKATFLILLSPSNSAVVRYRACRAAWCRCARGCPRQWPTGAAALVGQRLGYRRAHLSARLNHMKRALSQRWLVRPTHSDIWQLAARGGEFGRGVLPRRSGRSRRGPGVAGSDGVGQGTGNQLGTQVIGAGLVDDVAGGRGSRCRQPSQVAA
jgi:hypothetical protein